MGYFPFFMNISGKPCLIVGGGHVALRKAEKLLSFSPEITVVAPEICPELEAMPTLHLLHRPFAEQDVDGAFMVITATDDKTLNHRIYELCTERHIPVNSVDDAANCSFIFPALVHKDDITVGISTGGTSPVFARYLREKTEELLDGYRLETASILKRFRPAVKERFSRESERKEAMDAILDRCLTSSALPDDRELLLLLEELHEHTHRDS